MNPLPDAPPSASPPVPDRTDTGLPVVWGSDQLRAGARTRTDWLWQGLLAPGAVTLLTSQWKAGKTTLAAVLLTRMKTGGDFAGLPLAAGRALVVSEERAEHWCRRSQKLDFADHVGWLCRPFRGRRPQPHEWLNLIDQVAEIDKVDSVFMEPTDYSEMK